MEARLRPLLSITLAPANSTIEVLNGVIPAAVTFTSCVGGFCSSPTPQ